MYLSMRLITFSTIRHGDETTKIYSIDGYRSEKYKKK